ncbi:DNA polymerase III subunit alpha [Candidatus Dependentiae bacterium]
MSSKQFVPLHLHTEFSLLDGAIRLNDLVDFSKKQGWPACAISDHGNIFGAVKFFQLAQKAGIKPILGCEMYFTPDASIKPAKDEKKYFHILVTVQNDIGYRNLCRLLEFSYTKGFYFKPRIDYASLKENSEGLIVSTACRGGHIPWLLLNDQEKLADERIEWFLGVFGKERFYLEVMPPFDEETALLKDLLFKKAEQFGITTIATADSHYLSQEHHEAHEAMLCIGTKATMDDPKRMTFEGFEGHLKTTEEMLEIFKGHEESVWNTKKVADLCNFEFTFGKLHFPQFEIPKKHTEETFFRELCTKGLNRIFDEGLVNAEKRPLYDARLKIEMDLIVSMGYIGYFLVVSDFIAWAKKQEIPVGPGRGSAAGSLVAWSLQITNIDPLEYNLLFERFLNPERVSMPDIDIDFCIEGRESVINYVKEKYGHDSVCQIITFGTMLAKGVIKDVGRVLGFSFADTQALSDMVPDQLKITLKETMEQEPKLKELTETNPRIKHLIDICLVLEGLTRHASKHAAGVVIAPEPLRDVLPLYTPPKSKDLVTQYAMTELEQVGFLKMDFLGLKNLTVIDRTVRAVKKRYGKLLDLDKIPRDDADTFQTFCAGKTSGIFQFEGDGVTGVIQKLQPSCFEDLIAVNALYRPGPLGSGMVDDFIDRRHGRKKVTYLFDKLEPVLKDTYGVIVYQEQVMKIASVIAGFSLGAADILRRAMGKKKIDVMAQQKELFIKGATEKGFNSKKSAELFDLMAYFAGYGFNKSHSAAYALIAYQTAYLKTHYPAEFTAAALSFETKDPDKLSEYLYKARESGVPILQPDINESEVEFAAVEKGVRFGLKGIKNLGGAAIEEIIATRAKKPFIDFFDFCKRVNMRAVNKRVMESLVCSGAFDSLLGSRAQKFNELETVMAQALEEKNAEAHGQVGLFQTVKRQTTGSDVNIYQYKNTPEWTEKETLDREKEVVGFYLSAHPLDAYKNLSEWLEATPFASVCDVKSDFEVLTCVGLLQDFKVINTRKGDKMAFASFEDLSASCELVIFPSLFKTVEMLLEENSVFIIRGTIDRAAAPKNKIKANELIVCESFFDDKKHVLTLTITLPENADNTKTEEILSILPEGKQEVVFVLNENGQKLRITPKQKYFYDKEILEKLHDKGCKLNISLPEVKKRQSGHWQRRWQS